MIYAGNMRGCNLLDHVIADEVGLSEKRLGAS